jgi:prolipoprotein diacylglyceryltransferase
MEATMITIGAYRRRREAVYQHVRRPSAGGWKADLLHLFGSVLLLAVIIGARLWWHQP